MLESGEFYLEFVSLFTLFLRTNVDVAGSQGQFVQQSGEMRNLTLLQTGNQVNLPSLTPC